MSDEAASRLRVAIQRAEKALERLTEAEAAEDAVRNAEAEALAALRILSADEYRAAIWGEPPPSDFRALSRFLEAKLRVEAATQTAKGAHESLIHAIALVQTIRASTLADAGDPR
jgi:hypothetical protein